MSEEFKYSSVLIIDDSEMDILVNKMILTTSKFAKRIITKGTATAALEYLKELISNNQELPSFMFLDINMPYMNGFEFLEEIKKLPVQLTKRCKIAIISSSEDEQDISKVREYPFVVGYFIKPLDISSLKNY